MREETVLIEKNYGSMMGTIIGLDEKSWLLFFVSERGLMRDCYHPQAMGGRIGEWSDEL